MGIKTVIASFYPGGYAANNLHWQRRAAAQRILHRPVTYGLPTLRLANCPRSGCIKHKYPGTRNHLSQGRTLRRTHTTPLSSLIHHYAPVRPTDNQDPAGCQQHDLDTPTLLRQRIHSRTVRFSRGEEPRAPCDSVRRRTRRCAGAPLQGGIPRHPQGSPLRQQICMPLASPSGIRGCRQAPCGGYPCHRRYVLRYR